jgi:hypothetical protein
MVRLIRIGFLLMVLGAFCGLLVLHAQQGALDSLSPPQVKITFAHPQKPPPALTPEGGLPEQALYPHGRTHPNYDRSFADLIAHRISVVKITWFDSKRFRTHDQTLNFLGDLLTNEKTDVAGFHVWSNVDLVPCLTAIVNHVGGSKGRLLVWCYDPIHANPPTRPLDSPGSLRWAYQDGSGNWWWVSWRFDAPLPRSMGAIEK